MQYLVRGVLSSPEQCTLPWLPDPLPKEPFRVLTGRNPDDLNGFMKQLTRYLIVRFSTGGLALFVLALVLVLLVQMLRLFDLVTVKGQSLWTLLGQSALTSPPLSRQILYICMGIGLVRALGALQDSRELHTIHITRKIKSIWGALLVFSVSGAVLALAISNWAEPAARRAASAWSARIAVDLLSQTLAPGRFTDVSEGLVIRIGGRDKTGVISDFFAFDQRDPNVHRTYMAEKAEIVAETDGFQISLRNGRLQVEKPDGEFSEVEFGRYDLAIDNLTDPVHLSDSLSQKTTFTLISQAMNSADFSFGVIHEIHSRISEAPRVLALMFLIGAIWSFPHARRGRKFFPPELGVLIIAFGERFLSNFEARFGYWGFYAGPALVLGAGLIVVLFQTLAIRSYMPAVPRHKPEGAGG